MTNPKPVDFEAAFGELSTLNRLFEKHTSFQPPVLDPERFKYVTTEDGSDIVVHGLVSGYHYGSKRSTVPAGNGFINGTYSVFQRVIGKERVVLEWVRA